MADQAKRAAAFESWAQTVDRSARTANARAKSPGSLDHWLRKLGHEFDSATDAQRRQAAIAARRAHFARLAAASARARSHRAARATQDAPGGSPAS